MIELGEINKLISHLVTDILKSSGKDANEHVMIGASMEKNLKKLASVIIERAVKEAKA